MALPENISMSRITGYYLAFDGAPAQGEIWFYPTVSELLNSDGTCILRESDPLVGLVVDGELDVEVPATDNEDLTPAGWGYVVFEKFFNRRNDPKYSIMAPSEGVDLPTAAPVMPITEVVGLVLSVNGETPDSSGNVQVTTSVAEVDWDDVQGKPSTYPPSVHSHAISQVTGLQTALDGKLGVGEISDVAVSGSYDDLTDKPVIPDSPDDIGAQPAGDYATNSALTSGLAGKANASHTHSVAQVTGLQSALDGKAASSHTHTAGQVSGLASVATSGAYGDLSGTPAAVNLSDAPRFVHFATTWPARPSGSRMVFFVGGDSETDIPTDAVQGDVWIPAV